MDSTPQTPRSRGITKNLDRRSFLKAGALMAGAAATSSCGSGSGGTSTVGFLHNETDPSSIRFFKDAIRRYESDHPSVKIEMQTVSTDGRLQRLKSLQTARQMPGIFKIVPEERYTFANEGVIEPLDDVVDEIGRSDFVSQFLVPIEGTNYDIPYTINQFTVYMYRNDLFRKYGIEPARTWSEFAESSKELDSKDPGGGSKNFFGTVIPASQNRMTDIYFAAIFWSEGGTYFDGDFNVSLDADDAAVRTLEIIRLLAKHSPPGIESYSYSEMVSSYLTGKVAQDVYAPRLVDNLADQAKELLAKTRGAPRPQGQSGLGIGYANPNSFAVATEDYGNEQVKASKDFLRYLASPKQVKGFSMTAYPHMIPPLKGVQNQLLEESNLVNKEHLSLAKRCFDLHNTMDFTTEAGAVVRDGNLETIGKFNRYSPLITSRQISAKMVQDVLVRQIAPEQAVKDAATTLRSAVKASG